MNHGSKTSNSSRFKAFLCVAAYLPMMLGGAGTFVLCFGQGGHLAVEFAHEGGHDHAGNHLDGSGVQHNGSISDDGCNACFDIPLTAGHADPHTVKENTTRIAALHAIDSMQAASCAEYRTDDGPALLSNKPPLPSWHALEELSTIVLRT